MQWMRACFWMLIRFLTRFRYRVRVEGLEKLRDLRGPTLVMPNHPGLIDPPLVLSNVRIPGGLRPIVTTSMYRKPAALSAHAAGQRGRGAGPGGAEPRRPRTDADDDRHHRRRD